jgi:hypothetical protein
MKLPAPDEIVIEGDAAWLRIDDLTASYLEFVSGVDTWHLLYRDPKDGRLWEQTYPEGKGGPPKLSVVSLEESRQRYSIST